MLGYAELIIVLKVKQKKKAATGRKELISVRVHTQRNSPPPVILMSNGQQRESGFKLSGRTEKRLPPT